eukprot:g19198.t1
MTPIIRSSRCLGCALVAAAVASLSAFVVPAATHGVFSGQHVSTNANMRRTVRSPSSGGGVVMMGRRAAKIAKVKGREDAKRGKAFARIGKKIIMVSFWV